ncbi:hypothetical protein [Desulfonatronum thiosulfatophilum]|uniref:hypothetical protein n=1 Tax=Desulfonatronum thiosulfatophilum TaxID=617002 RepID=UPI001113480B|nr:hypothetical protein [Desulfonatronum thiosulfatophilum]
MKKNIVKILKGIRLSVGLMQQMPTIMRSWRFPKSTEKLLEGFANDPVPVSDYDNLCDTWPTTWATYRYRNASGSGAIYPGLPSWSGTECDALEGFARTMPCSEHGAHQAAIRK